MSSDPHQIARDFFAALSRGEVPAALLASDMTAWTASSGTFDRAKWEGGLRLLFSIFDGPYVYSVRSLTAEDDRVAAEVHAEGTLVSGENYANHYLFLLRLAGGAITSVIEHTDEGLVREKLVPLIMARMQQAGAG